MGYFMDTTTFSTIETSMQKRIKRESLRRRVFELCNRAYDTNALFNVVAEEVGRFYEADRCLLSIYEKNAAWPKQSGVDTNLSPESSKSVFAHPDGLKLVSLSQYCASENISSVELRHEVLWSLGYQHDAHETQVPLVISNPQLLVTLTEERLMHKAIKRCEIEAFKADIVETYQIHALLNFCITYRQNILGSISLHQCNQTRIWDPEEVALLNDIAQHLGSILYQNNIGRQAAESKRELERSYEMMQIITNAQNQFITQCESETILGELLSKWLHYMDSPIGFIVEILDPNNQPPDFKLHALVSLEKSGNSSVSAEQATLQAWRPLWQNILKGGRPIILTAQDLQDFADSYQPGLPDIKSYLGMPLYQAEKMVGLVGIANRPEGYSDSILQELQPLLSACANLIVGFQSRELRENLTQNLQMSEQSMKDYAAKLEQSNQELEQFATIASHDLQAPLRKVIIFTEYLKGSFKEPLSSESQDYLTRIQRATQKMQMLISDLLALSRVTRHGRPFKRVNLETVIREVLCDLEQQRIETGGQIEVSANLVINADAIQMHQVFQNLIANALKFHKRGEAPKIQVSVVALNAEICEIRVADNGIGFDEKYLDRIFSVFERLHGDEEYKGTGMGLAIVHKIISRHHGTVTAKSTPGQGSVFIVRLPIYVDNHC